jgi:peptide-methionine (S)-S-oxide reductase
MMNTEGERNLEVATLGGGCFWCLEAVYEQVRGVDSVTSGYAGGTVPNPSYQLVCTGTTGHAEVVQIEFDPKILSYRDVLEIFFSIHDPTTLNRQGADVGTQYRSVVFYHNDEQKQIATDLIEELTASGEYKHPIVTQVVPLDAFYRAEDYHQEYFRNNPNQAYCRVVISPKVAKFQRHFADRLKVEVPL